MVDVFGGSSYTRRGSPGPPGPQGKRGFDGSPGAKGSKGDRGDDGVKGDKGEKGDVGEKGERGDDGVKGEKGDVGPPGKRAKQGDSGLDIAKWMPNFILNEFRKHEESCCFMIRDLSIDLEKNKEGQFATWVSRNDKENDAKAMRNASTKLRPIEQGKIWGLVFDNSSYVIKNSSLKSGFACITFQLNHARGDFEQILFMDGNRGVSTNGKRITIYGVDNEANKFSFKYNTPINAWHTIIVLWLPNKGDRGFYAINSFTSSDYFSCNGNFVTSNTISLGGTIKEGLRGAIATFESYSGHVDERVPDKIWKLVFNAQLLY